MKLWIWLHYSLAKNWLNKVLTKVGVDNPKPITQPKISKFCRIATAFQL